MNYLKLEQASKSFGEKILLENISLLVSQSQKIALIAKNGSGKSTLLNALIGRESIEGEQAKLWINKNIRIGYLEQDPRFSGGLTVLDAALESQNPALDAIKKYEYALISGSDEKIQHSISAMEDLKAWDIEARVKEVLGKMKLHQIDQSVETLSGGQKKRLALARLLIEEPEFLILDEPTNHLDIEMIEWLEQYLKSPGLTLLMVTHDRYFMERICDQIIELDQGKLYFYKGNYSDYLSKKNLRMANDVVSHDKLTKLYKKELEWIRKQPKARTGKAKSRIEQFSRIREETYIKPEKDNFQLALNTSRLGKKIVEFRDVSKRFGNLEILSGFSYNFRKNEKLGIVGKNGVGKTSFIQMLLSDLRQDSGKIIIGETVVFGHFTQDGLSVPSSKTVLEVVRDIAEYLPLQKGMKLTAEQLLERFLFPRYMQRIQVSELSGGEQRRLHLLTVLMKNPNFLILDEPTNDLDILSLNVLEEYLIHFPGCLVVITHDRYLLDKIADHLFIFEGEGKIVDFNGSYTEYLRSEKYLESSRTIAKKSKTPLIANSEEPEKRRLSYLEKQELNRLEKELSDLEKQKKEFENAFLEQGMSGTQIQEISVKLADINKTIESKEERWFELSEL